MGQVADMFYFPMVRANFSYVVSGLGWRRKSRVFPPYLQCCGIPPYSAVVVLFLCILQRETSPQSRSRSIMVKASFWKLRCNPCPAFYWSMCMSVKTYTSPFRGRLTLRGLVKDSLLEAAMEVIDRAFSSFRDNHSKLSLQLEHTFRSFRLDGTSQHWECWGAEKWSDCSIIQGIVNLIDTDVNPGLSPRIQHFQSERMPTARIRFTGRSLAWRY